MKAALVTKGIVSRYDGARLGGRKRLFGRASYQEDLVRRQNVPTTKGISITMHSGKVMVS